MTDDDVIDVTVSVDGHELDDQQQRVVDLYESNIQTFLQKNEDYGGSFENSAKLESILRHGTVKEDELFDIIAEQILVRGFYDKLSRFHQLTIQDNDQQVDDEAVQDTLLDMANYAVMLAAMHEKYEMNTTPIFAIDRDIEWSKEDVESFMNEVEGGESEHLW